MSSQIIQQANDFWYEFDDYFLFNADIEVRDAISNIEPYGRLLNLFYYHQSMGTLNTNFKIDLENLGIKDQIKMLADNILRIIAKYFNDSSNSERISFELFAQGLLFDTGLDSTGLPRRQPGTWIHMMDSEVTGFVAWYGFIRAVIALGLAETNFDKWLRISRNMALGAAILTTLTKQGRKPRQTNNPNLNQPLDENSLNSLRNYWLNQNIDQIDSQIAKMEEIAISEHI
jgi:hypothetical protein